jgi:hypothetical protein
LSFASTAVGSTYHPRAKPGARRPPVSSCAPSARATSTKHALHVLLEGQRPEFRPRVERVADPDLPRAFDEATDELVGDRTVHEDPAAGQALLAVVRVDPAQRAVEGPVQVRRRVHDAGALAAEFEDARLQVTAGRRHDRRAGMRAAGEPDHVDAGVGDQRDARDAAAAVHEVDDARRQAGLVEQLDHPQHRDRRVLGRLQHAGVAERDAGRDAHRGERDRRVPRRDQCAHTLRLARHVGQETLQAGVGLAAHRARDFTEELEVARRAGDVVPDPQHRQAGGHALEVRELVGVRPQHVADPVEHVLAVVERHPGPRPPVEGLARGADGGVDLGGVGLAQATEGLLGRRVHDREFVTGAAGRHDAAGDQAGDELADRVRVTRFGGGVHRELRPGRT